MFSPTFRLYLVNIFNENTENANKATARNLFNCSFNVRLLARLVLGDCQAFVDGSNPAEKFYSEVLILEPVISL